MSPAELLISKQASGHPKREDSLSARMSILFWCAVVTTGLLQVWAHRNDMGPDGISYIELASASLDHGMGALTSAYWSPLYPFFVSGVFLVFHPSMEWQFAAVHGLNFLMYLASFACFNVFLKELVAARYSRADEDAEPSASLYQPIPSRSLYIFADLFFLWAAQFWLSPAVVSPDLCVAALVYGATAILLRILRTGGGWLAWIGLGVTLGLAYLAKAAMFPLSLVFLICAFLLAWRGKHAVRRAVLGTAVAMTIFLVMAAPWINALRHAKGRWTFGDSGKIAYAEYVNGAPLTTHWQGQPRDTGVPKHPTRQILSDPPMYEFAEPIPGSYPPWYDASYWYDGIEPHFAVRGQLWVLFRALNMYFKMFSKTGVLYLAAVALFWSVRRAGRWRGASARTFFAMLPSVAALALYAFVLVEFRYVSPFALMLLIWLISEIQFTRSADAVLLRRINLVVILALLTAIAWPLFRDARAVIHNAPYEEWGVATGLRDLSVLPGTELGSIGSGLDAYWAHLAGVRIIAEIPGKDQSEFIAADDERKRFILQKFADAGAQAVVTKNASVAKSMPGWQRIGQTQYYIWNLAAKHSS
jgi:hypothetical protein